MENTAKKERKKISETYDTTHFSQLTRFSKYSKMFQIDFA